MPPNIYHHLVKNLIVIPTLVPEVLEVGILTSSDAIICLKRQMPLIVKRLAVVGPIEEDLLSS